MLQNTYFINEAIDKAISNYLESKNNPEGIEYNSFLVVVVRTLAVIYDELDVINPYLAQNLEAFKANLLKFYYGKERLNKFLDNMQAYLDNEQKNITPNTYFILIEKNLIDMFIAKKVNYNIVEEEKQSFEQLLYSPNSSNELMVSFNYLHSNNEYEIINYYNEQMSIHQKITLVKSKKLLTPEAYNIINRDIIDVAQMDTEDIEKVNEEIYMKLNVKKNAINFEYQLEKAIKDYYSSLNKITTGNGYVDILLIISIIGTIIMLAVVLTVVII